MQFTAIKDFRSKELKSEYCAGLTYTVRPGNEALAKLLPQWVTEGLVHLGPPQVQAAEESLPAKAKLSGKGEVS